MITVPFTQLHMFLSMIITEIYLVSDPNYTVKIGSENYFSLAVGGLVGLIFLIGFIIIRFGSKIQFKGQFPKMQNLTEHTKRKESQLIKVVAR